MALTSVGRIKSCGMQSTENIATHFAYIIPPIFAEMLKFKGDSFKNGIGTNFAIEVLWARQTRLRKEFYVRLDINVFGHRTDCGCFGILWDRWRSRRDCADCFHHFSDFIFGLAGDATCFEVKT